MEIKVILLLTAISIIDAGLLNTAYYPKSFYGGFSYSPSYDALRNYNTAKYYAKKSYDLARLNAGIYGLGNGFYGFRYGTLLQPPFLGYNTQPLLPSVGQGYQKQYIQPNIPPPVFPTSNSYVPKSIGGPYSQSYAFGKGYAYSKNIFDAGPYLQYPKVVLPAPNFVTPPVPISKVTPIVLGPGFSPYTPGYQYSYFIKGPPVYKGTPLNTFTGYDSIYGTRYNKFPPKLPAIGSKIIPPYKGFPVGGVSIVKDPFQFNPNYGVRFDDYRSRQLVQTNRDPPWNNFPSSPVLGNAGYSLIPPVGDFSAVAPSYEYYTDPFNEYAARSDNDAARSDNNAARSDNELARSFKYDESTKKASDKPDLVAHGSTESKDSTREIESSSKTE
ncbi:uncharacterized protein CDAR_439781 [Caerostris darwini]|uniref:Uncharacterized protein n=1 Tax=Caerostris darwini TaxID=1538125 RepID=A0AAV4RWJ9_9ARAC|nr:uncharacterized protein CDAR_439781 [Caerostris darwini]